MSLTLGEKLQQAREARGITISEVAEQTRISGLYLEAIENNDYRTLPGGIFNKGFVKSYARYVGVDEQEALQGYNRLLIEQQGSQADELKTYKPEVLTDERSTSSSLMTIIFAVVILGLMTWGILAFVNYYMQSEQTPPVANNSNTATTQSNSNTAANSQPVPATNEIKLEFKALGEKINITYWLDGKMASKDVTPNETLALNPQQSVRISYYRGFTPDKVQLNLNGKQVAAPGPPVKGSSIVFEINKNNVAQILQSGQITASEAPTANTATTPR